jgi:very-short-patch-repair endonuclease
LGRRDRDRDAVLATAGYRTLRFTDRQIENAPATVVRALATVLDAGRRAVAG